MLNIHDLKAAYEKAIGHETSNSTVYNLLIRHGWRKLMPRLKITFSRTSTERAITITPELNYTPPNAAEVESTEAAIKASVEAARAADEAAAKEAAAKARRSDG
jgi:hypothetical protein